MNADIQETNVDAEQTAIEDRDEDPNPKEGV